MSSKDLKRGEKGEHESFEDRYKGNRGIFQVINQERGPGPARCKLGLIQQLKDGSSSFRASTKKQKKTPYTTSSPSTEPSKI
jgi:hypothetical protein